MFMHAKSMKFETRVIFPYHAIEFSSPKRIQNMIVGHILRYVSRIIKTSKTQFIIFQRNENAVYGIIKLLLRPLFAYR